MPPVCKYAESAKNAVGAANCESRSTTESTCRLLDQGVLSWPSTNNQPTGNGAERASTDRSTGGRNAPETLRWLTGVT